MGSQKSYPFKGHLWTFFRFLALLIQHYVSDVLRGNKCMD